MTTDKDGHEITSEDVEELENKLDIAVKALEDENYELNVLWQELKDTPGSRIKELGERVYERNRRVSEIIGTIERDALKEIQQHDLPDFARFENRSNTTTDVDK